MSSLTINRLFDAKAEAVAALVGLPIAFENVSFTPPASGMYIKADFMPAQTNSIDMQEKSVVYNGVYQLLVIGPSGIGSQHLRGIAERIAKEFPAGYKLEDTAEKVAVFVQGPASVYNGIPAETTYSIPVSLFYRAFL